MNRSRDSTRPGSLRDVREEDGEDEGKDKKAPRSRKGRKPKSAESKSGKEDFGSCSTNFCTFNANLTDSDVEAPKDSSTEADDETDKEKGDSDSDGKEKAKDDSDDDRQRDNGDDNDDKNDASDDEGGHTNRGSFSANPEGKKRDKTAKKPPKKSTETLRYKGRKRSSRQNKDAALFSVYAE